MKKPTVDYSGFRLSKLTEPRFSHLLLLLGWVVYFALYFLTENLIPVENCHVIHSKLDDIIPFCEWFLLPYVFWYLLIVISLGYFALYDVDSFKKLQVFIMITQALAMIVYIVYPNCQNLRPKVFPRENFLTDCIGLIYSFDTNTGVCPSLHCAYSIGIASVWLKAKDVSKWWKAFVVFAVTMICLSTMFIKQHSAVDFFAALPVCVIAEILVFKVFYKNA
ncbi:MAG: phosphatase PAP2 family protein [Lachnospiraceae bacterium]|nr:phosphatase PAP2 family protein [Lachnospiraceae bacterium]